MELAGVRLSPQEQAACTQVTRELRERRVAGLQPFVRPRPKLETKLDFYRIGKMLGRGAFGKVNLAMHKLVRKLVALKSLNKECLTDEV